MLHSSRALADVVIRVHVLSILVILLTVVLKKIEGMVVKKPLVMLDY